MKYEIKRSKRKTLSIQVFRDQTVQIRAPLRCTDSEIVNFFTKHQHWVRNKLDQSIQYPGLPESDLADEGTLWLLGESLKIIVNKGKPNTVEIDTDNVLVTQSVIADKDKTRRLIDKWKDEYAREFFRDRLVYWQAKFPVALPKHQFKLRKMKRQWGNCSQQGIITINRQLIRYPKSCIDYVLIHELTHLKHLNHGKNFYRLLQQICPDWKQQRLLLSQFSGV